MSKSISLMLSAGLLFTSGTLYAEEQSVTIGSPEFGAAVRDYLLSNPEVIFEAVEIHNQRQAALEDEKVSEALAQFKDMLFAADDAIVLGNPEASTTIVEFVDYNCGYCKKAHEEVKSLLAANDDVKVIIRQFPILSQGSLEASQIALAIGSEFGAEKAAEFHNALYAQDSRHDMTSALAAAEALGLDAAILADKAQSPEINEMIQQMHMIAANLKIEGTPGFIIGDEIIRGYIPLSEIERILANS